MDTYYKVLAKDHKACHGGTYTYTPGEWTERIAETGACESGYHVATLDQLTAWLFATDDQLPLEVWECEADGVTNAGDKCVCERIRLTRLVITLDEYDLRWIGTMFAESVLCNTDDPRVGECINAVRAYSLGFLDDLSAARSAVESAACSAAESAAWSAAESAARSAAWSAAWSAACSAARSAVESAACSAAEWAARSAAESAAWSAARSANGRIFLEYVEAVS